MAFLAFCTFLCTHTEPYVAGDVFVSGLSAQAAFQLITQTCLGQVTLQAAASAGIFQGVWFLVMSWCDILIKCSFDTTSCTGILCSTCVRDIFGLFGQFVPLQS